MDIKYDRLEENVATLEVALALEALHAARDIRAEPATARGGPWSKPGTLSTAWLAECSTVANFRSLSKLGAYAEANSSSPLGAHLRNVRFQAAAGHDNVGCCIRGALITRKKKSGRPGTPGNARRKEALKAMKMNRGKRKHRRAHRGKKPKERRRTETANLKKRREEEKHLCFTSLRLCADVPYLFSKSF